MVKAIGIYLLLAGGMVIVGFFLKSQAYWMVVGTVVMVGLLGGGIILVTKKL